MKNRASLISGTPLAIQGNGPWRTRLMLVVGFLTIAVSSGCGVDHQNAGQQLNVAQQGATIASVLFDHPDGIEAPPPYGLRLDGVEWAVAPARQALAGDEIPPGVGESDTWTFSFEEAGANVTGTFDEGAETFRIMGTAFGGRDTGNEAAGPPGPGEIFIDFTYIGVTADSLANGVQGPNGSGGIIFIGQNQSIDDRTIVFLQGYPPTGPVFQFDDDNHRLNCPDAEGNFDEGCGAPVGSGWLAITSIILPPISDDDESMSFDFTDEDGNPQAFQTDFQDWLFTTRVP